MHTAMSLSAIGLASALCISPAAAQTADALREALVAPRSGWTMNWPQALSPWTGVGNVIFEARGDRLVALIENHTANVSCERDVTVMAEEVRFDLCRETGLVLRHSSQDREIPLRGRTAQRWYIFYPR